MTTVTEAVRTSNGKPVIICDVSPPRGAGPGPLDNVANLDADFLSIAYNPGQSVRVNSVLAASYVLKCLQKPVVFTLATRDMNRIAIQSLLLGASWNGLHNVVVVRGDQLRDRDRRRVKSVNDYTTTALLSDISQMNRGRDFRGLSLSAPTSFCSGATVDFARGIDAQATLAARKISAGAQFLLCQAHFYPPDIVEFQRRLTILSNEAPTLFAGVQVLASDGIDFGNVPDHLRIELDAGRSGLDIAKELALELWTLGVTTFYLIPTIRRGGVRDYHSAADLVSYIRSLGVSLPTHCR